ncbi:MAG: DUF4126 family protein [Terriglobia bacterium]
MSLLCAAGIGAVSGLRSFSGPAFVKDSTVLKVLAAGELIADKLPFIPNRTETPSLVFRAASGAFCGYTICGKRASSATRWFAAMVGATAAVASAYGGFEYRRRVKLPPLLAALLEDAVAVGTGRAVISAIGR